MVKKSKTLQNYNIAATVN